MPKKTARSALFKEAVKRYSRVNPFRLLPEDAIEELAEIPLSIVSVGPGREQTIIMQNPFKG